MTNERLHEVLVDCQYIPGEYLVSTLKIRRVEYFEKGEKIPYILYVIHIGGLGSWRSIRYGSKRLSHVYNPRV